MQDEAIETIELSDPQFEFLTSKKKHTGFVAGFGSGKSFIGTLKTLLKIIDDKVPKVAYYLPTYGDIRDIAFDGFPIVAEMLGYEYKLNKTDKEFILFNGKEKLGSVIFRNMSEPESIVGYQVGYTLIDETDILKQAIMDKAFKKILGRNRLIVPIEDEKILQELLNGSDIEGTYFHKHKKVWCYINSIDVAGTPEGFKWFYSRFKTKFNPLTDLLVQASTYSNMDNLPEDFIETLRSQYPSELFEAYVNGTFINLTTGTIFYKFKREINCSDVVENDSEELFISQDFNIGGCVSVVYVKRDGGLVAVNEYESFDTFGIVQNTKRNFPNRVITFFPDASGDNRKTSASETDIDIIKKAGFKVVVDDSNPSVKDRINISNNCFEKNIVKVNIKRCPKYTQSLEQHAYNEKGEPEKIAGAGTVDDYTDAGTYILCKLFPLRTYAHIKGGFVR